LVRAALKTLRERTVKRHRHPDIKAPAYKRQPKFLTGFGSNLYAKTTVYTLARFINQIRVLNLLNKQSTLALISAWSGPIFLSILS
jgi:hypothetical protein